MVNYKKGETMGDYLALVNKENKFNPQMVEGFKFNEIVDNYGDTGFVEQQAFEAFCALKQRVSELGVKMTINSAGRTIEDQKKAFLDLEKEYGTEYAKSHTAMPGFSEHHTGLAIDVKLEKENPNVFERFKAKIHNNKNKLYEILDSELTNFGFIKRYTADKSEITGFPPERWHIRFVGRSNALAIAKEGLCLEEYVEKIKAKEKAS